MRLTVRACVAFLLLSACDATAVPSNVTPVAGRSDAVSASPVPAGRAFASAAPQCPPTSASSGLPRGTRRFGRSDAPLPLSDAGIANISPADADDRGENLNEDEYYDVESDGLYTKTATYLLDRNVAPNSLVCRYGKRGTTAMGEAMLLIPVTPQDAVCLFTAGRPGRPASMICRPGKPKD